MNLCLHLMHYYFENNRFSRGQPVSQCTAQCTMISIRDIHSTENYHINGIGQGSAKKSLQCFYTCLSSVISQMTIFPPIFPFFQFSFIFDTKWKMNYFHQFMTQKFSIRLILFCPISFHHNWNLRIERISRMQNIDLI